MLQQQFRNKIPPIPFPTEKGSGNISLKMIFLCVDNFLVGCFGLNGPLRQYFSLYRAVSQREGERKEKR